MEVRRFVLATLLIAASAVASASTEGVLELRAFQVSSSGIGQSGPILVSGERTGSSFSAFCVQAFGATTCLNEQKRAQLSGVTINGVQISFEVGYKQLGGRTVYVLLSKGFVSGRREGKVVSVNEAGNVAIKVVRAK